MAFSKLLTATAAALDRRFGWDRLPRPLGVVTLVGLRTRLRQKNLHDTGTIESVRQHVNGDRQLRTRTLDGSYNDLDAPRWGRSALASAATSPSTARTPTAPRLLEPNPRLVSRELLTRDRVPAGDHVNVLAAAWLQFMVHDWFSHGKKPGGGTVRARPRRRRRLARAPDADPAHARPTPAIPDDGSPPTYVNADSHWWDGSQIYGSDAAFAQRRSARSEDGKLRLDPDGLLPRDLEEPSTSPASPATSGSGSRCCTRSSRASTTPSATAWPQDYPAWSDDELFDRARLINAALMAKIHTVEWTPAIIAHPTTRYAMRANWWGVLGKRLGQAELERGAQRHPWLADRPLRRALLADRGVRRRLPDAPAHPGRLHVPLARDGRVLEERTFRELGGLDTRARLDELGARRTRSTRSGSRTPARSRCTTSLASCRTSSGRTGRSWTWPPPTSCASASSACRATTSSAGCST